MSLTDYFLILRPKQWYKNLLLFLPLVFVGQLFNLTSIKLTIIAFISFCCISSANYIINDFIDIEKDKQHPEKKNRPLAAGKIKTKTAFIEAGVLIVISILIALQFQNKLFLASIITIFILTQAYTLFLKKELFADILSIGANFVIRASAGTYALNVKNSPWLILCTFFLSLYLSVGKRAAELTLLGDEAKNHRETLAQYTKEITQPLLIIATTLLITAYSLYSFLSERNTLLYTLPFALYVIFRYFNHIQTGSEIARHPEKAFTDKKMVIGMMLWGVITVILLYFPSFR
ncbi:UbiA prenyltransferase family protein [Candidatus Woesearchaeota archaeon]|nr:UbiA prenyltransferase family protein [Candidatus Woesearchaeota archaeon]